MPRQSEIDRMLVLFYRSNNAHGYTNFSRPYGWLDKLPMAGLDELERMLQVMELDVAKEKAARLREGMPIYSREHHKNAPIEPAPRH